MVQINKKRARKRYNLFCIPQLALFLALLLPSHLLFTTALKRKYSDIYALSAAQVKTGQSYTMTQDNALNICACDVTKGSCDAYCCCDREDCAPEVISFWNENYNDYCAKNDINRRYKSKYSTCIDNALLKKANPVAGMTVINRDTQTCIELNVPSAFSEYKGMVDPKSVVPEQAMLDPDYLQLTIAQDTYNARNYDDYTEYY